MVFNAVEQAGGFEVSNNGFTRGKAFHAPVFFRNAGFNAGINAAVAVEHLRHVTHVGVEGENIDHRQAGALAHFVVVKIVRRGHFYRTGAFFHVGVFVAHNRNTAVNQRQNNVFAD